MAGSIGYIHIYYLYIYIYIYIIYIYIYIYIHNGYSTSPRRGDSPKNWTEDIRLDHLGCVCYPKSIPTSWPPPSYNLVFNPIVISYKVSSIHRPNWILASLSRGGQVLDPHVEPPWHVAVDRTPSSCAASEPDFLAAGSGTTSLRHRKDRGSKGLDTGHENFPEI